MAWASEEQPTLNPPEGKDFILNKVCFNLKEADYESKFSLSPSKVLLSGTNLDVCGRLANGQISVSINIAISVVVNLTISINISVTITHHLDLDI